MNPLANLASRLLGMALGVLALGSPAPASGADEIRLLNASFDISRELFREINPAFAAAWKEKTGGTVAIRQTHDGSSKQARSVIDGLEADVLTFNQVLDIDILAERGGLVPADWRERFPHRSSPFTSTIVFLVRKGNPKNLRDWPDLVRPGIAVIVPNPKTSGNGRYSYLAAWAFALKKLNLNQAEAGEFVGRLFRNAPVLDTGGRGATTTFAQHGIGDVLLTFEAEAHLTVRELGANKFEIVIPSFGVEAEMPVAVVEKVARRRGTETVARAYLEFLYTEAGQEIIARHDYRPRLESVARRYAARFGDLELFTVDDVFGGWPAAHREHFAAGGNFDRLAARGRK
jgi:sulfate transport system substrate-binding protein